MNTERYQKEEMLKGDSEEDTRLLQEMAKSARRYLQSFAWCPTIESVWLAFGIGGVVGVFLVKFATKIGDGDEWLWTVNGDLPSAYMVTDNIEGPGTALETYCRLMEDWVNAVNNGTGLGHVFPVKVDPTLVNATKLSERIEYLRKAIIPLT